MKEIDKLNFRPFTRFCMSIGAVPSSYIAGMTIEEQLLWFCSYLEKEVIPAVNNNGEAVEELQGLFTQLHDYVEHYFDNLDVQEEINNKLDAMVEDGTMNTIINQEIFGDINNAINTINNTTIPAIQDDISTINNTTIPGIESEITAINTNNQFTRLKERPTIFVGDSYLAAVNNYGNYYITLVGLSDNDYYKFASNGAGFYATGSGGYTFLQTLQNNAASVTDKTKIKQIIVGSGLNDAQYTATIANMNTAISDFLSYCKTTYPNAIVYICLFGFNANQTSDGGTKRFNLAKYCHYAYSGTYNYDNYCFIKSSPYWLKDSNYFDSTDYIHPTQSAQQLIAQRLASALIKDNSLHYEFTISCSLFPDGNGQNTTSFLLGGDRINDIIYFSQNNFNTTSNIPTSLAAGYFKQEIGTWSCTKIFPTSQEIILSGLLYLIANSVHHAIPGQLVFAPDGKVYLRAFAPAYSNVTRIAFAVNNQSIASFM